MGQTTIAALNVYPVKSCRGIALDSSILGATGLEGDRRWMVVNQTGRFVTQRDLSRLALVVSAMDGKQLRLSAPDMPELQVGFDDGGPRADVTAWNDRCPAFDMGAQAAEWFSRFLGQPLRLVRFDPAHARPSNRQFTGEVEALNQFSDGYPVLVASQASLDDLNTRLPTPLPMNRFRPNIVLEGLQAYDEDRIAELVFDDITLRLVKPCTRCKITTTDQDTAQITGPEPLLTLRSYRWDEQLRGVTFAQNAIILKGIGMTLRVRQRFEIRWKE